MPHDMQVHTSCLTNITHTSQANVICFVMYVKHSNKKYNVVLANKNRSHKCKERRQISNISLLLRMIRVSDSHWSTKENNCLQIGEHLQSILAFCWISIKIPTTIQYNLVKTFFQESGDYNNVITLAMYCISYFLVSWITLFSLCKSDVQ